jgi:hypothetical protein
MLAYIFASRCLRMSVRELNHFNGNQEGCISGDSRSDPAGDH